MTRSTLFATCAILALAVGCGAVKNKKATEKVVEDYLNAVKAKEFDKTKGMFGEAVFKDISKDDWVKRLTALDKSLGALKSWKQTNWKFNSSSGKETVYMIVMETTYEKGGATETFTISQEGGTLKIVGFNFKNKGGDAKKEEAEEEGEKK